ncbi:hypothetical protein [Streptomyces scopuliridis]|uniref:hypothetical protein n=1 Tax=Streptomyces scopuliridis TaxID=452529 RepID=UPI0036861511
MRAMIARPIPAVTTPTTPTEPRPRGDRPVGIPPIPTHTGQLATLLGTGRTVRAGDREEIQQEEDASGRDGNGYEEEPESALGTPLLADPDQPPLPVRDPGKTLTPPDDALYQELERYLVVSGDQRAAAAGRQARRTLTEMVPGYIRQPILRLTRPLTFRGADDACVLCGFWNCKGDCYAPAPVGASCTGTGAS